MLALITASELSRRYTTVLIVHDVSYAKWVAKEGLIDISKVYLCDAKSFPREMDVDKIVVDELSIFIKELLGTKADIEFVTETSKDVILGE